MKTNKQRWLTIHLGMSKTGTTFLQKQIFPGLTNLEFLDQPSVSILDGPKIQGGLARIFKRSPAIWDYAGDTVFHELFNPESLKNSHLLVSDQSAGPALWETESYTGSHWKQSRQDPFHLQSHLLKLKDVAVKNGFTQVKILIVIRRQDEWIASKYAQRSNRIKRASQSDFENRVSFYLNSKKGYFSDGIILNYHLLNDILTSAMGKENVLMIPFELLRGRPEEFLSSILGFLDVPEDLSKHLKSNITKVNVRSVTKNKWALRNLNRNFIDSNGSNTFIDRIKNLLRRVVSLTEPNRGNKIVLSPELRTTILSAYIDDNYMLNDNIKFDLNEFGYFPEK